MKIKILVILFLSVFLVSCGTQDTPLSQSGANSEKMPFIVKTQKLSDFSGSTMIEKSGRITASSSLTLTSKWIGEISKILVKEWQYVHAWAMIAILRDTVNNFDLRLDQAENALAQQSANIATTEANLNNSVEMARVALERARLAYESATGRKNITFLTTSTTNLKTLDAYNVLYKNYLADLERQMTQMLYSGDRILGISPVFENMNNSWEAYLGAYVGNAKSDSVNQWNSTYSARGDIRARQEKGSLITANTAGEDLKYISDKYELMQKFADSMIYLIQQSTNGWSLTPELQAWWLAEWNGIRGQIQASMTWYNTWKSQVLGFLRTYQATEKAIELAVASLTRPLSPDEQALIAGSDDMRVTYETTRLNLRDSIENARLGVEQAQSAYDNAIKIRTATLAQMRIGRDTAQISLAQAKRDYAKLAITAPIEGTVTRLRTSVGESINTGSPIADFAGKKPEVLLDIDPDITKNLWVGDSVEIDMEWTILQGKITALSTVAGNNLLSTVRIVVENGEKYIGRTVLVRLRSVGTLKSKSALLPLDALRIISEWEGEVSLLGEKNTIIKKIVKIENIGGENVEVSGELTAGDRIIVTNLSNFDPLKNTIQPQ